MNLINRIFSSNNDSYTMAKNCLSRVRTKLDSLADNFPDVTIPEILMFEEQWKSISETLGEGVSVLSLEANDNYTSFLAHYNDKAYFAPHEHKNDYELNKIIKGSIINKLTGERFETGDTFIIDKGERHYLQANEESYVYCMISPDEDCLTVPQIKPNVLKRFEQLNPGL